MNSKIDLRKNGYENNPFIKELEGKMYLQPRANTVIARGEKLVSTETGEVLKDEMLLGRRKYVDKSQFAKIYCTEIGILYELSKTATNVFFYLTKVMTYDNEAYLNVEREHEKVGYKSKLSVTKAIKELITKNILAKSYKVHHYWLNPLVVCKGERFAKYYEYVIDETGEHTKAEAKEIVKSEYRKSTESIPKRVKNKMDRANEILPEDANAKRKIVEKKEVLEQKKTTIRKKRKVRK